MTIVALMIVVLSSLCLTEETSFQPGSRSQPEGERDQGSLEPSVIPTKAIEVHPAKGAVVTIPYGQIESVITNTRTLLMRRQEPLARKSPITTGRPKSSCCDGQARILAHSGARESAHRERGGGFGERKEAVDGRWHELAARDRGRDASRRGAQEKRTPVRTRADIPTKS